jgi:hypothetical protein
MLICSGRTTELFIETKVTNFTVMYSLYDDDDDDDDDDDSVPDCVGMSTQHHEAKRSPE